MLLLACTCLPACLLLGDGSDVSFVFLDIESKQDIRWKYAKKRECLDDVKQ